MKCSNCDGAIELDTRFCGRCGTALPGTRASSTTGAHAAVPFDADDLDALTGLNGDKQRLTDALNEMLTSTNGRAARDSEQHRYEDLRNEWIQVSQSITAKLEVFSARTDSDRRERLSRGAGSVPEPPERRARADRRNPFPETL
jgi:hypothetical protein